MTIDYTAASNPDAFKPKPRTPTTPVTDGEPDTAVPSIDLHAFTHCPDCRAIIHRASGCPACLTGIYAAKE